MTPRTERTRFQPAPDDTHMPNGVRIARSPDLDWYFDHLDELIEKYPNECLAIKNQRVLAHAPTHLELADQLPEEHRKVGALIVRASWDGWESYKEIQPWLGLKG